MTTQHDGGGQTQSREAADPWHIIGVGASAGGLEAIKTFFDNVPPGCRHSFVLIQHLSPDYKSLMGELIKKNTTMPIVEATDDMAVEPGTIYLIPPKKNIRLRGSRLALSDKPHKSNLNLPIDIFLTSLAEERLERAIGIILTGTGSDGTRGVRAIKEAGGMVMVQDPADAMFDGMPLSAINTGLVDYVLPVAELPTELLNFIAHPIASGVMTRTLEGDNESMARILQYVRNKTDLDFDAYKRPTLARRIERRMGIKKCSTIEEYTNLVASHSAEAEILSREFLIGVTKFMRDPDVWEALSKAVLADLVRSKAKTHETLRVWSVGCSTGEEAYTIGIMLREEMKRQGVSCDMKIFATDISEAHLAIASKGIYPESILGDLSPERLGKFFVQRGDEWEVNDSLRSHVIFSPHNILRDPPFKDIDIVVCRNVLIYFQSAAQRKALASLHYALKLNGILMLGPSETVGDRDGALREIDSRAKIFQNQSTSRGFGLSMLRSPELEHLRPRTGAQRRESQSTRMAQVLNDAIFDEFGLAAVYVDEQFDIIHATGAIRRFAELPAEGFSSHLLRLLDDSVAAAVSTACRKAKLDGTDVVYKDVRLAKPGDRVKLDILARPFNLEGPDWRQCFLIVFIPREVGERETVDVLEHDSGSAAAARTAELEQEITDTRESLQAAIEELETTNEELQASNEELLAANEELQSTNEELQSMNEELHTVNSEHQQKIADLAELNADMDNLLASTDIGTIFLDRDLRIRKFTPAIIEQFNLHSGDIGRPLAAFASSFEKEGNRQLAITTVEVMDSGEPVDLEIPNDDGRTQLVKIAPFRALDNEIDGVVISFVDVTELSETQARYHDQAMAFEQVLEGTMAGYWDYRPGEGTFHLSPSLKAMLGYRDDELPNTLDAYLRMVIHPDDQAAVNEELRTHIGTKGEAPFDLEVRCVHRDDSPVWVWAKAKTTNWTEDGEPARVVGTHVDITVPKEVQRELERSNDDLKQFAYLTSHDLQEPLRTVTNFVEVLQRNYDKALDDDARHYLEIIMLATARMRDLIRGLLDYSRIGRDGITTTVDTETLVTDVVNDFATSIDESGAVVEVGDLPKVVGYETELRTLFGNLLSNAIKFRAPGRPPTIGISARDVGRGVWQFIVEDDGIGIAPEYLDRIFEIFQRLHSRDTYEGAGIGLAHCRKIVDLHGGTIWVESEPGTGSRFKFTLALTDRAE